MPAQVRQKSIPYPQNSLEYYCGLPLYLHIVTRVSPGSSRLLKQQPSRESTLDVILSLLADMSQYSYFLCNHDGVGHPAAKVPIVTCLFCGVSHTFATIFDRTMWFPPSNSIVLQRSAQCQSMIAPFDYQVGWYESNAVLTFKLALSLDSVLMIGSFDQVGWPGSDWRWRLGRACSYRHQRGWHWAPALPARSWSCRRPAARLWAPCRTSSPCRPTLLPQLPPQVRSYLDPQFTSMH